MLILPQLGPHGQILSIEIKGRMEDRTVLAIAAEHAAGHQHMEGDLRGEVTVVPGGSQVGLEYFDRCRTDRVSCARTCTAGKSNCYSRMYN